MNFQQVRRAFSPDGRQKSSHSRARRELCGIAESVRDLTFVAYAEAKLVALCDDYPSDLRYAGEGLATQENYDASRSSKAKGHTLKTEDVAQPLTTTQCFTAIDLKRTKHKAGSTAGRTRSHWHGFPLRSNLYE